SAAARPPLSSTPFPYTTLFRSAFGADTGRPRFSRDGRTLLYVEASEDRRPHLRARALDTGEDRALAEIAAVGTLAPLPDGRVLRSEEHTSELQSRENLVCRLLL